jgi:hypothetical protein
MNIVFIILFLILYFVTGLLLLDHFNKKRISEKVDKFDKYVSILEYHMLRSYDIIYKDKILIYSLEGMKIDDKEFNIASKDFAYLVLKMLGPNLKDEFIDLYGDEDTLIFNVVEYFNTKFENDEVRERSKQNIFSDAQESILSKEELTK